MQELDSVFGLPQQPNAAQPMRSTQPVSNAIHSSSTQPLDKARNHSMTGTKLTHVDATGLASMVDVSQVQQTTITQLPGAQCIGQRLCEQSIDNIIKSCVYLR
jgi:hypothetical protein